MPATYEPIATTTLGSAAASITFSSIPATYTDLRLVVVGIPLNSTGIYSAIRVNSDTGTNYSTTAVSGNGTSAASSQFTSTTSFIRSASGDSSKLALWEIDLFSYAGSTNKTALGKASSDNNGTGQVNYQVGLWRNTAAINAVSIYSLTASNMEIGSTITLYGIKNA